LRLSHGCVANVLAFNPDFPLGREAMSRRFGMQFSRHFYRRIGDTAIQNVAENALKATDSVRDS
jgi:hypothetical protein